MSHSNFQIFLSYKRDDLKLALQIARILRANGLKVWKDLEYLPLGQDVEAAIQEAIASEVSGFAYLVTPSSLKSDFIWKVELPAALRRLNQDLHFTVFPLFTRGGLIKQFRSKSIGQLGVDLSNRNGAMIYKVGPPHAICGDEIISCAGKLLVEQVKKCDFVPIQLFSHGTVPTCPADHLVFDFRPFFEGLTPNEDSWRSEIIPCFKNLRAALLRKDVPQRSIWLPSRIHLSLAIAYGYIFRRTTGFNFVPSASLKAENDESIVDDAVLQKMQLQEIPGVPTSKSICLAISIAKDVETTIENMRQAGYEYRACLSLKSVTIGPDAIINTTHARILASQAVKELLSAQRKYKSSRTDIFVSSSVQFACFLGWHLNACGSFTVWQYDNEAQGYVKAYESSCFNERST